MSLTDRQLAIRSNRIAATDVAAILGLNPWRSPADVRTEKLYDLRQWRGNEQTALGERFERAILEDLADSLGLRLDCRGGTRVSQDDDLFCATPDGLLFDAVIGGDVPLPRPALAGAEAKTGSLTKPEHREDWGADKSGDFPIHYQLQCDACMFVTGLTFWHVGALLADYRLSLRRYVREFDPAQWAGVRDACRAWWQRHIVDGAECGTPSLEVIARIVPSPQVAISIDGAIVAELDRVRNAKRDAEVAAEAVKHAIAAAMMDAGYAIAADGSVISYLADSRGVRTMRVGKYDDRKHGNLVITPALPDRRMD